MYLDLDVILAELKTDDWLASEVDIELVGLSVEALDAAGELRSQYQHLNVFDGVHLGTADTLDEPIVSTDTLYPDITEVEHVDPRDIG